jgi:pentatricopeptide repeat protein
MKRSLYRTLAPWALVGLAGVGAACQRTGWTTSSPEALEVFEGCIEAQLKLYREEARSLCREALRLDPEFTAAKLRLFFLLPPGEERARLGAELQAVDLGPLSSRERFLVRHFRTTQDGQLEAATELLDRYLESHPTDPYALEIRCAGAWDVGDWDRAAPCYQKLLKFDPNWVSAQNNLGYLAMALGRFDEAEDHFRTYLFIAPNQANPHDSLAELLMLRGRYDEARDHLEQALATRPDFCASWNHLIQLHLYEGHPDKARSTLERMLSQGVCGGLEKTERCRLGLWGNVAKGDLEAAWQASQGGCAELDGDLLVLTHGAALATGRRAEAERLVALQEKRVADLPPQVFLRLRETTQAQLRHLQGQTAAHERDPARAAELFRQADELLRYPFDAGLGLFKLYNRLSLAAALEAQGRREEAERLRAEVAAVNPRLPGSGVAASAGGGPF